MSEYHKEYKRSDLQNRVLDLEEKYMYIIENIVTSKSFLEDLKKIESEVQEYYDFFVEVWGKKNKIKEASERLLRHHMYKDRKSVV